MKFPNFPKKCIRDVFCDRIFVEVDKVGHFCEPVYYYYYLGFPLRFWWLGDEGRGNGARGGIRDFQRLEQSVYCMPRGFSVVALVAASYIVPTLLGEAIPAKIPRYYLNCLFLSEVSRYQGVVTAWGYLCL